MGEHPTRVLVTGASGLIGSHVVQALLDSGYRVRGFSRGESVVEHPQLEHFRGDVRDPEAVAQAIAGCDWAIHTAALYSYRRALSAEMEAINVEGTRTVLDAAARFGVRRVVVTSSAATCGPVAGRPADEDDEPPAWELRVPYKRTKLDAERLALERAREGQDVVVVNPTTTVGSGDRRPTPSGAMILDVLRGRMRGYLPSFGLNVVGARDVGTGHVLALERGRPGERYLLGGENLSMRDLLRMIARLSGAPAPMFPVPYPVVLGMAQVVDGMARAAGREPKLMSLDEVRLARLPMYFCSAKAQEELGYRPRSSQAALAEAVGWFLERARGGRESPLRLRGRPAQGGGNLLG